MFSLPVIPSTPTSQGDANGSRPRTRVVRYGAMRFVGEFSCKPNFSPGCGDKLVVETDRGIELGELVGAPRAGCGCDRVVPRESLQTYVRNSGTKFCTPRAGRILRVATDQDLNEQRHLDAHINEDIAGCAEAAHQLGLDIRVVTAEHLLGGERIVFYFTAPTRVDFRDLVKQLAQRYRTRIEMRQVGARDEARLVADYEVCGRECCCKSFLKELRPVSMKMAKVQKSTLDPSKVSGRCGRLRCCLRYEHTGYEELLSRLPRIGSRVGTDFGPATVIDRQVLTQLVMVQTDDNRTIAIPLEEITAFDLPPAPPPPEPRSAPAARTAEPARARPDAAPAPASAESADAKDPAARLSSRRRRRRRKPDRDRDASAPPPPPSPAPLEDAPRSEGNQADRDQAGGPGTAPAADAAGGSDGGPPRGRRRHGRRRRRRSPPASSQGNTGSST